MTEETNCSYESIFLLGVMVITPSLVRSEYLVVTDGTIVAILPEKSSTTLIVR